MTYNVFIGTLNPTHFTSLAFALCCHSNATRAPIANSAQLGGIDPIPLPKLHPGPCNSVGMRPRTDSHTDRQTHRRAWPQYISRRLRLTRNVMISRSCGGLSATAELFSWQYRLDVATFCRVQWFADCPKLQCQYNLLFECSFERTCGLPLNK